MEDLAGLNFTTIPSSSSSSSSSSSAAAAANPPKKPPSNQSRITPSAAQQPTYVSPLPSRGISPNYYASIISNGTQKAPVASQQGIKHDSFASLSFLSGISAPQKGGNPSLEAQRLAKEREKKDAADAQQRKLELHFGADEFWERQSRGSTPKIIATSETYSPLPFPMLSIFLEVISRDADLAAFSSEAPVNTASHFPPPTTAEEPVQDPFDMSSFGNGLSVPTTRPQHQTSLGQIESTASSDDILGLLARPVESFQKPTKPPSTAPEIKSTSPPENESSEDEDEDPRDKAIAAIVEMGFSIGQATKALSHTPDGLDVQMALDNLLSRPSSSASTRLDRPLHARGADTPDATGLRTTTDPFARQPPPTQQHKDLSQIAGEVGNSLWKGAGNLWKSGREKMNTLIQEYQAGDGGGGDPSMPKWMREQQRHPPSAGRRSEQQDSTMTEEARKLAGVERPAQRPRDRISLAKQAEQDAEMGYRSSARRKVPSRTATPQVPVDEQPTPSRIGTPPAKVVDLFSSVPALAATRPSRPQTPQVPRAPSKPATPKPTRPIPPISDAALSSSSNFRQKGSEAFKLGDYTQALTHYTSALAPLPAQHPQRTIVLSNRAITNLKLGDAKAAIADCDELIALVGNGGGEGENVQDGEGGTKSLKEIWGKGIVRRASGLEMLEKWEGALEMWKIAVDAGVGGTQTLDGKRRCESALGISLTRPVGSASMARSRSTPATIALRTATPNQERSSTPVPPRSVAKPSSRPAPARVKGPSAVETLAQYNAAAAAEEDEKVGLYDTVDAKITAWQGGKESNLRALLSSLDSILWPEAGWKKVNMAELVVANRVKIVYMKAIAKVHPDKISTGATVEQKMVAAAVFAKLNGAWAIFKEQNGL